MPQRINCQCCESLKSHLEDPFAKVDSMSLRISTAMVTGLVLLPMELIVAITLVK